MAYRKGYNPAKGADNRSKYPTGVGPNYDKYGEQPGYVYDPYSDKYRPDPKAQKELYQQQGLVEEDPRVPGLFEQTAPLAVAAAAPVLGKEIITQGGSALKGLLGRGSSAAASTAAPTAASGGAEAVGSALNGGTLMSDGSVVAPKTSFLGAAAPWLGVAGAGLGAYGIKSAMDSGSKRKGILGGLLSGAGMGGGLAMAAPLVGLSGPLAPLMIGGGLLGGLLGAGAHESTADRSARRWGSLDSGDQSWEDYKKNALDYSLSDQASDWDIGDSKESAPIDEIMKSYGVAETFGPQWLTLTPEQQRKVATDLVYNDLINNKQGELLVTDQERARQLAGL